MKKTRASKRRTPPPFPKYLKPGKDNKKLLRWIGNFLKDMRGKTTISVLAGEANVPSQTIKKIEAGTFSVCLGQLRQILSNGYKCSLEDVLADCYEKNATILNPSNDRKFDRDWHYRFCFSRNDSEPTPYLVGGKPGSYLWAAPFRRLKDQYLSVELLELARAKKYAGHTDNKPHDGVEVIHVINGTIRFYIKPSGTEGEYNKELSKGDSIHFNSLYRHSVRNDKQTHSALMLIVRHLEPKKGKSP